MVKSPRHNTWAAATGVWNRLGMSGMLDFSGFHFLFYMQIYENFRPMSGKERTLT